MHGVDAAKRHAEQAHSLRNASPSTRSVDFGRLSRAWDPALRCGASASSLVLVGTVQGTTERLCRFGSGQDGRTTVLAIRLQGCEVVFQQSSNRLPTRDRGPASQPTAMRMRIVSPQRMVRHEGHEQGRPELADTRRGTFSHAPHGEEATQTHPGRVGRRKCGAARAESADREGVFGPAARKCRGGRGQSLAKVRSRKRRSSTRWSDSSRSMVQTWSGAHGRGNAPRFIGHGFSEGDSGLRSTALSGRSSSSGCRSRDRHSAERLGERRGGNGRREATRLPARGTLRRV